MYDNALRATFSFPLNLLSVFLTTSLADFYYGRTNESTPGYVPCFCEPRSTHIITYPCFQTRQVMPGLLTLRSPLFSRLAKRLHHTALLRTRPSPTEPTSRVAPSVLPLSDPPNNPPATSMFSYDIDAFSYALRLTGHISLSPFPLVYHVFSPRISIIIFVLISEFNIPENTFC